LGSPVIDDISRNAVANISSALREAPAIFDLSVACGQVSGHLKPTVLACLTPPKSKPSRRFMNVHRLVRWPIGC